MYTTWQGYGTDWTIIKDADTAAQAKQILSVRGRVYYNDYKSLRVVESMQELQPLITECLASGRIAVVNDLNYRGEIISLEAAHKVVQHERYVAEQKSVRQWMKANPRRVAYLKAGLESD